jgi:hypothetical protein
MIPLLVPGHGDGAGHPEIRVGTLVRDRAWRVTGFWTHGATRFANLTRVGRAGDTQTVTVARLRGER